MASVLDLVKHYQHAIEKYPNDEQKILKSIDKLFHLGVTVQHLQETGVGRTVNALRKEPGDVGHAARALVYKWKCMVAAEESDQEGDHNESGTHNGHGNAKDSDESLNQSNISKIQYVDVTPKNEQKEQLNGNYSGTKRKYQSSEEEEPNIKKTKSSTSSDNDKYKRKTETQVKSECSESDSDDQDSDNSLSEDSESDTSESSADERRFNHKIKTEPIDKHTSSSKQTSHSNHVDNKKESSSSKKTHTSSEKHSKHHNSESKHSSEKTSSHEKSYSSHKHKSSKEKESSSERKHKSENKPVEKEKSHKEDSKSSSKHSSSEKHRSSSQKSDGDKHKSNSEKHSKSEKHSSSETRKSDKDKHKSSSEKENSVSRHKSKESSSNSKEKDSSSSKEKEKSKERSSSSKEKSSDSHKKDKNVSDSSKSSSDRKKRDKSDERNGEKKSKHKSSSSSSHKSSKSKEDVSKKKHSNNVDEGEDGIDCGSGASFAEALGMISPVKPKKKSTIKDSYSPGNPNNDLSPAALLAPTAKLAPLPDLEISALPDISPNYKPRPPPKPLPHFDEEAMSAVLSSKNQRTKVYSGNKIMGKIPSLYEMCVNILQEHIDALEFTGGVPYEILKPVVDKATPQQLFVLEHYNPYLMEDTDHLWQTFCEKHFRTRKRQELESWREMYMRCQEEQEHRLKSLTANIKLATEAKKAPIKQTKMAYVDTVVKPPRNIARKQAQHGTAHAASASPAARVAALATAPNVLRGGVRPSLSTSTSSSNFNKPKKAPLMQKALQFMRGRKR